MRKIHFMSAALMAILVTSMGGIQQASALMGSDVVPAGGVVDFYELIDGSGSITTTVFNNQLRPALATALGNALDSTTFGNVRVTVIQFGTSAQLECAAQANSGNGIMINGPADVTALQTCVNNIAYLGAGNTNIASAYSLVANELAISPIQGANDRSIVDLITDGNHNTADNLANAFNSAVNAGLDSSVVLGVQGNQQINVAQLQSLAIPTPIQTFNPFDPNNDTLPDPLITGFVIIINNFGAEFTAALEAKLDITVDTVGGELIPIDSAALLIAGAQTNAVWLLSALAVIGSVAFGAFYLNTRKQ